MEETKDYPFTMRFLTDEREKLDMICKTYNLKNFSDAIRKLINQEYDMLRDVGVEIPIGSDVSIFDTPAPEA